MGTWLIVVAVDAPGVLHLFRVRVGLQLEVDRAHGPKFVASVEF